MLAQGDGDSHTHTDLVSSMHFTHRAGGGEKTFQCRQRPKCAVDTTTRWCRDMHVACMIHARSVPNTTLEDNLRFTRKFLPRPRNRLKGLQGLRHQLVDSGCAGSLRAVEDHWRPSTGRLMHWHAVNAAACCILALSLWADNGLSPAYPVQMPGKFWAGSYARHAGKTAT